MSKSKRAHSIKARSASKTRSKAATRKSVAYHRTRANSKQARVLALLRRPNRYDRYDRDRRHRDSDFTVGVGPGGVTVGPRHHCRMVTTTIQRDDGRTITRRERRCD